MSVSDKSAVKQLPEKTKDVSIPERVVDFAGMKCRILSHQHNLFEQGQVCHFRPVVLVLNIGFQHIFEDGNPGLGCRREIGIRPVRPLKLQKYMKSVICKRRVLVSTCMGVLFGSLE